MPPGSHAGLLLHSPAAVDVEQHKLAVAVAAAVACCMLTAVVGQHTHLTAVVAAVVVVVQTAPYSAHTNASLQLYLCKDEETPGRKP